jgi:Arc/MetJ-type ribon-helix-helix transcriptional regulator
MSDWSEKYGGLYPSITIRMTSYAERQLSELVNYYSTRMGKEVSKSEAVRWAISAALSQTVGKESPQTRIRAIDGKTVPTFGPRAGSKPCSCGVVGSFCDFPSCGQRVQFKK